jgi:flagellar transcriptional activator FlhD
MPIAVCVQFSFLVRRSRMRSVVNDTSWGEKAMRTDQLMDQIREANLSYLMLAQAMVRDDKDAAIYRLGVSADVAGILERLTPAQLVRMAASNMLLFRFRFDDRLIVDMLSDYGSGKLMAGSHATVLMAARPAAGLTA